MERIDAIIEQLRRYHNPWHDERDQMVAELRAVGLDAASEYLVILLSDPDQRIRWLVASAAFLAEPSTGQALLLPMLEVPESNTRYEVCGLLYDFGGARAVPALVARLQTDPDVSVRMIAADAIGRIASREAVPALAIAALEAAAASDHELTPLGYRPSESARNSLAVIRQGS